MNCTAHLLNVTGRETRTPRERLSALFRGIGRRAKLWVHGGGPRLLGGDRQLVREGHTSDGLAGPGAGRRRHGLVRVHSEPPEWWLMRVWD